MTTSDYENQTFETWWAQYADQPHGKRQDTIISDALGASTGKTDQTTTQITYDEILKMYRKMSDTYYNQFNILTPKEKDMIGGPTCHLCGAATMFTDHSCLKTKKNNREESQTVYECGTTVFKQFRVDPDTEEVTKVRRHIHVGDDCISVD